MNKKQKVLLVVGILFVLAFTITIINNSMDMKSYCEKQNGVTNYQYEGNIFNIKTISCCQDLADNANVTKVCIYFKVEP